MEQNSPCFGNSRQAARERSGGGRATWRGFYGKWEGEKRQLHPPVEELQGVGRRGFVRGEAVQRGEQRGVCDGKGVGSDDGGVATGEGRGE